MNASLMRLRALATATLVTFAAAAPAAAHSSDMVRVPAPRFFATGPRSAQPVTVYLRRDGGTIAGGWDDSASDSSSLALRGDGGRVVVPRWKGGERKWGAVVECVRQRYAEFAVDVVDQRPAGGDYIMAMVGGNADLLGYDDSVAGVAPFGGEVMSRAVVYVFSEQTHHDVENTCVGIVHEVGHALGLDHVYRCEDPMTYLWGCGKKRFVDVDAPCGENEQRSCQDGAPTQNSYRKLATAVGLRDDRSDDSPADHVEAHEQTGDEPADGGEEPAVDDDVSVPEVSGATVELGGRVSATGTSSLVAEVTSDSGVMDVVLLWMTPEELIAFSCNAVPDEIEATCVRDGNRFSFSVKLGADARAVAAVVLDDAGEPVAMTQQQLFRRAHSHRRRHL